MVYIIALALLSSYTWCPMDQALLSPLNAAVTQASSPSFIPQCAGLSLIGCVALYSWYSCNEKAIKLTTLCGALASSYILYKYVHGQEEVKELVMETTEHLTQTVVDSETRINTHLQTIDARTQQQISHVHHALQSDLTNLRIEFNKKMDATLTEMREQFVNAQKQNDINHLELEHTIAVSSANVEHNVTQHYLELSNILEQKKEESDKLLQESTNYMVTQMQNMLNELARAQSITLPVQKHTFTPQKLAYASPPPQVVRRSVSQPDIYEQLQQPTLETRKHDLNQQFEQTKENLQQKYTQQKTELTQQYATKHDPAVSAHENQSDTEYQQGMITTPVTLEPLIFDAPSATAFRHKPTLASNNHTSTRWFNIFALFNLLTR